MSTSAERPRAMAHGSQHAVPWCAEPWYALHLADDFIAPCCYIRYDRQVWGNALSLLELGNSEELVRLRERLAAHDLAGMPCANCHVRSLGVGQAEPRLTRRAGEAFASGRVHLDYPPYHYAIGTSSRCNLRCAMCYTTRQGVQQATYPGVPLAEFFAAAEKAGWENISCIGMSGGEPLLTGEAREALEYFAAHGLDSVELDVTTNGTLLQTMFPVLEASPLRRFRMTVSVDGTGPVYESIRVGASWSRLAENLETLAEMVRVRPGWRVEIHSLLMRTTFGELVRVVDLAAGHGFGLRFNAIFGSRHYGENVFTHPELLTGLDWAGDLERGIAAARAAGLETAAQDLETYAAILGRRLAGTVGAFTSASFRTVGHWQEFLACEVGDRDLVVAGLNEDLFALLQATPGHRVRAVADFDDPPALRTYAGVPVLPLEELGQAAPVVVVNAQTYNVEQRMDQARRLFPGRDIFLLPIFGEEVYARIGSLVESLGARPVVLYGAGGTARVLYGQTRLKDLNVVAFADGDACKHGTEFCGRPVHGPDDLPGLARDVVVLSQAFSSVITGQISRRHGDAVAVHTIF